MNRIGPRITSVAAGITRRYAFAGELTRDVADARAGSGIHVRTTDVVGNAVGKEVGDRALGHSFRPIESTTGTGRLDVTARPVGNWADRI